MDGASRKSMGLLFAVLALSCRIGAADIGSISDDADFANPWRNENGTLAEGTVVTPSEQPENNIVISYRRMGNRMLRIGVSDGLGDLGGMPGGEIDGRGFGDDDLDSGDDKWTRRARESAIRLRMLIGPEGALAADWMSSGTEEGVRNYLGAVVPLTTRWELAVINKFALFKQKDSGQKRPGARAGVNAATIRVGANPGLSFRPWFELTPYTGLDDRDGGGIGFAGGAVKNWANGISLQASAHLWQPWDEGYLTALHDGRKHGVRAQGTLPVGKRLALSAEAGVDWLELGSNAPGGGEHAGHRGDWRARADFALLKRDGAYMGYGFREQTLRDEELVPVEFGLFIDAAQSRYWKPEGFAVFDPVEKSFSQRAGLSYAQAVSPHIGFTAEAFIGRDLSRGIGTGELYGASARLNIVLSPSWRLWLGWGYESHQANLEGGDGPSRHLLFGFNYNF